MMRKIWAALKFIGRWLGPVLILLALGFELFPISPLGDDQPSVLALAGAIIAAIAWAAGWKRGWVRPRQILAAFAAIGLCFYLWTGRNAGRDYVAQTVSFDNRGAHLVGTLYLPKQGGAVIAGKVPAILFLPGSGAVPRQYYRHFATVFAKAGYATLLYDKRGIGDSTPRLATRNLIDTDADNDLELLASDAAVALALLEARPEIKADNVGVGGDSQGGIIAPRAAELNGHAAFMLNLCTATTSLYEVGEYQTPKTAEGARRLALLKRRVRNFEPMPSLRALDIPGLWLMASSDSLVDNKATVRDLDILRKDGKRYEYKLIPRAFHGLFIADHDITLDTINGWLARMAAVNRPPTPAATPR